VRAWKPIARARSAWWANNGLADNHISASIAHGRPRRWPWRQQVSPLNGRRGGRPAIFGIFRQWHVARTALATTIPQEVWPARSEMPDTIKRSSSKAQRTWSKIHDSAVEYGEVERAHRTAFAALKHSFEKNGDRWAPKRHRGPSDPRARRGGTAARSGDGETFGGVDYEGNMKQQLYERARALDISGRSTMSKNELARAISRQQ
jgi:hypothetical protein